MNATAEASEIALGLVNAIGLICALWLLRVALERRSGLAHETHSITPKGPRFRTVNRQIRDRSTHAVTHGIGLAFALLLMFDVEWPSLVVAWSIVGVSTLFAVVLLFDLRGELQR